MTDKKRLQVTLDFTKFSYILELKLLNDLGEKLISLLLGCRTIDEELKALH